MKIRRAFFPGSFDPFTKGHEAIVSKGLKLVDEIVIGLGEHSSKSPYFSLASRKSHIASLFIDKPVRIIEYSGLTVDACKIAECDFILRGLRDSKDFQYERSIAHMNFSLKEIDTVFVLTDISYASINSTIVREIHLNGGLIGNFVTNHHLLIK